ncbi:MAG: 2-oxoacid:ferredoxin oxidoreductase subunit beta, partial [Candidatus Thermoplasmatota archaeon]|nr:2-oxoacid:ferredoxin oxidoreductase subunit beta [Candidatus Thermoplasmatota archaeon]
SLKSYGYVKSNDEELHAVDYIPHFEPITEVEVPAGEFREVQLHDGSFIRLETIGEVHDPSSEMKALEALHRADVAQKHVTGLLYFNPDMPTLDDTLNLVETPLAELPDERLRPSPESLEELLASFRE